MSELLQRLSTPRAQKELLRATAREGATRGDWDAVFASFGYTPHPKQREFHTRFGHPRRVLLTGRRFGKSTACAMEVAALLLAGDDNGRGSRNVCVVAPEYELVGRILDVVEHVLIRQLGFKPAKRVTLKDARELVMPWGGRVVGGSAKNPEKLLGEGWSDVYCEEAARLPKTTWESILEPALLDMCGNATFVSTPLLWGWISDLWALCTDAEEPDWWGLRAGSMENPHLNRNELEKRRKRTDPRVWAREYEGLFVALDGAVFPEFSLEKHGIGPAFERDAGPLYWGWDVGASTESPHALVVCQRVWPHEWRVVDEFVAPDCCTLEFARRLRVWWEARGYHRSRVMMAVADAAARDAVLTFAQELRGHPILPGRGGDCFGGITRTKPRVESSIELVRGGLTGYEWRLLINGTRCPILCAELAGYQYRPITQTGVGGVVKQRDHTVDALRYILSAAFQANYKLVGREEMERIRTAALIRKTTVGMGG